MNISALIDLCQYKLSLLRHHLGFYLSQRRFLKYGKLPKLSKAEKKEIQTTWRSMPFRSVDYIWHRIYKRECGFSPFYLSEMQVWYMLEKLNPYDQVVSLQNKALCDLYLPQIPYPTAIIRGVCGRLYNHDMQPIGIETSLKLIKEVDSFIIKPSVETLQGKGVKKINSNTIHNCADLQTLFDEIGQDFILQKIVRQHPEIERLNATSLNTCRVTSILINGNFQTSTNIKIGKLNSIKDNWNSSYFVNIDKSGMFAEFGYDYHLNKVYKTDNGIPFKGLQMPYYDKMLSFVELMHRSLFPQCGVIGWDITIDNNGEVSVVELNLTCPGIAVEQLCSGDFLKRFCLDINEAIKVRKYHTYKKHIL